MSMRFATAIVTLLEAYGAIGLVFAVVFLRLGLVHVDPRVVGAPRMFRMVILPGVAAFWPLFARRWLTGAGEPAETNPHRTRARPLSFDPTGARPREIAR